MSNPLYIAGLLSQYFPESAITGILANIDVETGGSFDFTQQQGKGPGYGLFQFDDQKEAYFEWLEGTAGRDSAESQIKFVSDAIYNDTYNAEGRLTTPLDIGPPARKAIREAFNTGSTAEITRVFSEKYENPNTPRLKKRLESAAKLDLFKGLFTNPL